MRILRQKHIITIIFAMFILTCIFILSSCGNQSKDKQTSDNMNPDQSTSIYKGMSEHDIWYQNCINNIIQTNQREASSQEKVFYAGNIPEQDIMPDGVDMTEEYAMHAALKVSQVYSSGQFSEVKTLNDNGIKKYSVEFIANKIKYKYIIEASSRTITEKHLQRIP